MFRILKLALIFVKSYVIDMLLTLMSHSFFIMLLIWILDGFKLDKLILTLLSLSALGFAVYTFLWFKCKNFRKLCEKYKNFDIINLWNNVK